MKKSSMLKAVNLLIAIAFALLAATSAISKIVPDKAPVFFEIHELAGYVFFLLAIIHIALNWPWIKANFLKKRLPSKSD